MRRTFFSLFVPAVLFLAGCMSSDLLDLKPGHPADLTPQELVAKMEIANDPKWIQRDMRSYIMRQEIVSTEPGSKSVYTSEILFKLPDKFRQKTSLNGRPISLIYSMDGRAWNVDPDKNRATEITGHELKLVTAFNNMLRPGHNYLKIFHKVDIDQCYDDETGREYYRLICYVDSPDVAPYVFYVNPDTFLTDKFETIVYGNGAETLYIAHNEDYRWENGICVPKRSFIKVAGKTDVSTVTEFKINPDIPDSEFELPKQWYK